MKRVIAVRFSQGDSGETFTNKTYCYFSDIPDLTIGDWVLVVVDKEPKCAKVTAVEGLSKAYLDRAHKWIAAKIDLTEYENREKKQALVQEIKNQLQQRRSEAEEFLIYERLAAHDPEIKALLDRLRMLDPDAVPQLPGAGGGQIA